MPTTDIKPFRVAVPQTELDALSERLRRTRWPDELPGSGWDYGAPLEYVKVLAEHWQHRYDWREHEAALNALPQFTTDIQSQSIYFLHVRSPEPNALPLLLTHGWPGSVIEFWDVIGPLSDPRAHGGDPADAFDLVIPAIPGFGFSGPTLEKGWDVRRVAGAWTELMRRLGYDHYGAQGGDFGSAIARHLGAQAPEHVLGVHLNYLVTAPSQDSKAWDGFSNAERARATRTQRYLAEPAGYLTLQATRPQTLAYGLTDSPVGQLAWIAEKFATWTDPETPVSAERLLSNVMLYWLTGTAHSSARLYFENAKSKGQPIPCPVPLGVAVFPHDLALPLRRLAERAYTTVTHWREFNRGGHFAALEVPDLFTDDVRTFFRTLR